MPVLAPNVKAFIVQSLACFDTPSQVVEAVKKEFDLQISRQQAESHDPTKFAGRALAKKWIELFHETREKFKEEAVDIPIANRAFRLRALDRMASRAEGMRNLALAAQLMEQAAKETGGAYTNRREVSGPGGGPIPTTISVVGIEPKQ
jgi:hypothetical protein